MNVQLKSPDVFRPLSVFDLAKLFGLEVSTVRKKIAGCVPARRKTSGYLYHIKDVAPHLVDPVVDVESYMASLSKNDLPENLRPTYWDAKMRRLKFEQAAKELWQTEDVIDVMSSVFQTMRSRVQLMPDVIERQNGVRDADRALMVRLLDDMLDDIHEDMVRMAGEKSTPSALERFSSDEDDSTWEALL